MAQTEIGEYRTLDEPRVDKLTQRWFGQIVVPQESEVDIEIRNDVPVRSARFGSNYQKIVGIPDLSVEVTFGDYTGHIWIECKGEGSRPPLPKIQRAIGQSLMYQIDGSEVAISMPKGWVDRRITKVCVSANIGLLGVRESGGVEVVTIPGVLMDSLVSAHPKTDS